MIVNVLPNIDAPKRRMEIAQSSIGARRAGACLLRIALVGVLLLVVASAMPAQAQSLIDHYQAAHLRARAAELFRAQGSRVPSRPVASVPTVADSLVPLGAGTHVEPASLVEEPAPRFVIRSQQLVRRLGRSWFEKAFAGTQWSYLGSGSDLTPLDTMLTRDLRARLQAHFGQPTETLVEKEIERGMSAEDYIQFEYWFVVNDSIPVIVMDVNGPFERGVVVASSHAYRSILPYVREALFEQVLRSVKRAPYVDYYYNAPEGAWYRTGFDGNAFFLERIRRPNLARGRPWIGQYAPTISQK
jgi:hypothetical protein